MTGATPGRATVLGSTSRRAAVLGSPISHSLSPVLHRAAYDALGLPWSYDAIECDEAGLAGVIAGLHESYIGLSLTMPLKRAVVSLLHEISPLAVAVGAVNTVTFSDAGGSRHLRGDNTDAPGLVASVRHVLADAEIEKAAILGAGGTAAAAVAAVRELGLTRVDVVVRDAGRARDLVAAADRLGVDVVLQPWPAIGILDDADLVVSAVPAGAADTLADRWAPRSGSLLFDVLYEPWPTRLATAAAEAGARVIGGLELLVRQAALQVESWSGKVAPVEAMREAGEQALIARTSPR